MTRYLLPLFLCIAGMGQQPSVNQERPTNRPIGCVTSGTAVECPDQFDVDVTDPQAQEVYRAVPSLAEELAAFIEYQHADYMMEHFCLTHTCEAQVKYREIRYRKVMKWAKYRK